MTMHATDIEPEAKSKESFKKKVAEGHLPNGQDKHQIASGAIDDNACNRNRTQSRIPRVIKKEGGRRPPSKRIRQAPNSKRSDRCQCMLQK